MAQVRTLIAGISDKNKKDKWDVLKAMAKQAIEAANEDLLTQLIVPTMMLAPMIGDAKVELTEILKAGANPNTKFVDTTDPSDQKEYYPMHYAAQKDGGFELIKLLMAYQAKPLPIIKESLGQSPIERAATSHQWLNIAALLEDDKLREGNYYATALLQRVLDQIKQAQLKDNDYSSLGSVMGALFVTEPRLKEDASSCILHFAKQGSWSHVASIIRSVAGEKFDKDLPKKFTEEASLKELARACALASVANTKESNQVVEQLKKLGGQELEALLDAEERKVHQEQQQQREQEQREREQKEQEKKERELHEQQQKAQREREADEAHLATLHECASTHILGFARQGNWGEVAKIIISVAGVNLKKALPATFTEKVSLKILGEAYTLAVLANTDESKGIAEKLFRLEADLDTSAQDTSVSPSVTVYPLTFAATHAEHGDFFLLLVGHGADLTVTTNISGAVLTPLEILAKRNKWDLINRVLKEHLPDVKTIHQDVLGKILFAAVQSCSDDTLLNTLIVENLIEADATVGLLLPKEPGKPLQCNALDLAVEQKKKNVVARLLTAGAKPTLSLNVEDKTLLALGGQLLVDAYAELKRGGEGKEPLIQRGPPGKKPTPTVADADKENKGILDTSAEDPANQTKADAAVAEKAALDAHIAEAKKLADKIPTDLPVPANLPGGFTKMLKDSVAKLADAKVMASIAPEKRKAFIDRTRKLIDDAVTPFAGMKEGDEIPQGTYTKVGTALSDYREALVKLSPGQRAFVAGMSLAGTIIGLIVGFAAGLAVGVAIGFGVGSVIPVFGNIVGAITAGSATAILAAVTASGLGATIGGAAGAAILGTGAGVGAAALTRLGAFKVSGTNLVRDVANSVENLIKTGKAPKPVEAPKSDDSSNRSGPQRI